MARCKIDVISREFIAIRLTIVYLLLSVLSQHHKQLFLHNLCSGVAGGGQVGARTLGRRPWGRISTLFAVI